jgi:hypothetical protein
VWPISLLQRPSSASLSSCANDAAPSAQIPHWYRLFSASKLILDLFPYCRYISQFQGTSGFAALFRFRRLRSLTRKIKHLRHPVTHLSTKSEFLRLILYNLLGISDLGRSWGFRSPSRGGKDKAKGHNHKVRRYTKHAL